MPDPLLAHILASVSTPAPAKTPTPAPALAPTPAPTQIPEPREITLDRHPELGFGFVAGSEKPVIIRWGAGAEREERAWIKHSGL